MKSWRLVFTLVMVLFLFLATTATTTASDNGSRKFFAILVGAAETPVLGDLDGFGLAVVSLHPDKEKVCFDITVKRIDKVIAAHIHVGETGVAGPIVVDFMPTVNGLEGCVKADDDVIKAILKDPLDYYVNVHTETFKGGAVRGQLFKFFKKD